MPAIIGHYDYNTVRGRASDTVRDGGSDQKETAIDRATREVVSTQRRQQHQAANHKCPGTSTSDLGILRRTARVICSRQHEGKARTKRRAVRGGVGWMPSVDQPDPHTAVTYSWKDTKPSLFLSNCFIVTRS